MELVALKESAHCLSKPTAVCMQEHAVIPRCKCGFICKEMCMVMCADVRRECMCARIHCGMYADVRHMHSQVYTKKHESQCLHRMWCRPKSRGDNLTELHKTNACVHISVYIHNCTTKQSSADMGVDGCTGISVAMTCIGILCACVQGHECT